MALEDLKRKYAQLQGLLNTPMNQQNGLLGNIPQAALLGSAIFGQGIQGRDPFSALLPAVAQTAQVQKLMTPKRRPLKQAFDPKSGKNVFATDVEIREQNLEPARTGMITTINPNTGEYTSVPVTEYGNIQKKKR